MKKILVVLALVVGTVFAFSYLSYGHGGPGYGRGGQPWGMGYGRGPMHIDPANLKTLKGKVVSVETAGGFGPRSVKIMEIETEGKKVTVHLGPAFYLDDQKFAAKAGDEVSVVGAEAAYRTKTFIVAKSVTVRGKTLVLRDERGLPAWRGMGRHYGRFAPGWGMMGPGYGHGMWSGYGMGSSHGMGPGGGRGSGWGL